MTKDPQNPIVMFLGEHAAAGGPYAILGLKHSPINDGMIRQATRRCIEQINRHPRSRTPFADEARLAVHAAASQLTDPKLRGELAQHWPEGKVSAPVAWSPKATKSLDHQLRTQARALLGASGGWNAKARKRLSHFARTHNLSAIELVSVVQRTVNQDKGAQPSLVLPSLTQQSSRSSVVGVHSHPIKTRDGSFRLMIATYALLFVFLLASLINKMSSTESLVETPNLDVQASVNEAIPSQRPSAAPTRRHVSAVTFELQNLNASDTLDLRAVSDTISELCMRWTEYAPTALRDATKVAIELLTRLEETTERPDVLDRLPKGVLASAIVFAIEQRQPDLMGEPLQQAFMDWSKNIPRRPESWADWVSQLRAYSSIDAQASSLALRNSLDSLFQEPVRDSAAWIRITQIVSPAMNWRRGSEDRVWLLGMLQDQSVRSERLSVFLNSVLTYSSAPGLKREHVIAPDSGPEERSRVFALLRNAWAVEANGDDDPRIAILQQVETLLSITPDKLELDDAMTRTIELARVNAACRNWALGDTVAAIVALESEIDTASRKSASSSGFMSSRNDVTDAELIRNESDPETLIGYLDGVARNRQLGPWVAQAVVYTSIRSPSSEARDRSLTILQRASDQVPVLIALEHALVQQRPNQRVATLVSQALGITEQNATEEGIRELRRALLERIHTRLTLGESSRYEEFEQLLARAYRAGSADGLVRNVEQVVFGARVSLMSSDRFVMDPGSRDRLEAYTEVVFARARGALQRTLAQQLVLSKSIIFWVKSTYPSYAKQIDKLEREHRVLMSTSPDSARQMLTTESLMAKLWKLVIEAESVS